MASAVEGKISEGIKNALESVVSSREEYYSKNPLPSVGDVKSLKYLVVVIKMRLFRAEPD